MTADVVHGKSKQSEALQQGRIVMQSWGKMTAGRKEEGGRRRKEEI